MEKYEEKYFEEKFNGINDKLDSIERHVKETNGRVNKLEEEVELMDKELDEAVKWGRHIVDVRASECPQVPLIKALQENMITEKAIKKVLYISLGIISTIIAIILGVVELFFK